MPFRRAYLGAVMSAVLSFVVKRRIGRASFALVLVVLWVIFVAWVFATAEAQPPQPDERFTAAFFVAAAFEVVFLLAVIYRLHDLGWSGWWVLAVVLPEMVTNLLLGFSLARLVIIVFFSLMRGQPGDNKWGPVPWPAKRATATMPAS